MSKSKLMSVERFRKERYVDPPDRRTIISRIERGIIPGRKEDGRWYVEVDEHRNQTGDELVDQVLRAG